MLYGLTQRPVNYLTCNTSCILDLHIKNIGFYFYSSNIYNKYKNTNIFYKAYIIGRSLYKNGNLKDY